MPKLKHGTYVSKHILMLFALCIYAQSSVFSALVAGLIFTRFLE